MFASPTAGYSWPYRAHECHTVRNKCRIILIHFHLVLIAVPAPLLCLRLRFSHLCYCTECRSSDRLALTYQAERRKQAPAPVPYPCAPYRYPPSTSGLTHIKRPEPSCPASAHRALAAPHTRRAAALLPDLFSPAPEPITHSHLSSPTHRHLLPASAAHCKPRATAQSSSRSISSRSNARVSDAAPVPGCGVPDSAALLHPPLCAPCTHATGSTVPPCNPSAVE